MSARLSRWTWLLVLPMVVGSLLLMHGVAPPGSHTHAGHDQAIAHHVVDLPPGSESVPTNSGHCPECLLGHLVMACAAVLAAAGGITLAARTLARIRVIVLPPDAPRRLVEFVEAARAARPAWVRLSVMRC